MKTVNCLRSLAIAVALLGASASSHASLILAGSLVNSGSGFGNVNTLLTLNNAGGSSTGGVARNGGVDVTSGNVQAGASHNATYSFAELNITNAEQIRLIFNANEPGNAKNSISVDALTLSIYSEMGGSSLFSTSIATGQFFATTANGIGSIGYVFVLDALSTTAAQSFISGTNRLGLSSSISLANSGPDTFLVSGAAAQEAEQIPEPASMLLLGLGMVCIVAASRRA